MGGESMKQITKQEMINKLEKMQQELQVVKQQQNARINKQPITYEVRPITDNESYAVPIQAVREVLDFLPYASTERVMFQMLFYTGCRASELDRMTPELIYENLIYWEPGKGQKGFRKEALPIPYIKELACYRETHRVRTNKLFSCTTGTFRRYFDRDVRPQLSPAWNMKRLNIRSNAFGQEYALQLKGLRKTFATLVFAKEWQKWGAAEVAMEFACKRMKHSSKGMTVSHYLDNFESLRLKKMSLFLSPDEAVKAASQTRMADFDLEKKPLTMRWD